MLTAAEPAATGPATADDLCVLNIEFILVIPLEDDPPVSSFRSGTDNGEEIIGGCGGDDK